MERVIINSESVDAQHNEKESRSKNTGNNSTNNSSISYDELKKHYFSDFIGQDETTVMKTIRFLPWSATDSSIFKAVKAHIVRATNKDGVKKFNTFMCPKNEDPNAPCPFCELAEKAGKEMRNAKSEAEKKQYKDIFKANIAQPHYIARLVDRDDIASGVKFWRFKDTPQGPFEQLYALRQIKAKMGVDIFHPYEGKDIVVTIKKNKDNKRVITLADYENKTPIFESNEEMLKWVQDTTDYKKLFPTKPYEYLAVVAAGGYPVRIKGEDGNTEHYVDKETWEKMQKENELANLQENLNQNTTDFSSYEIPTGRTPVTSDVAFSSITPKCDETELPY